MGGLIMAGVNYTIEFSRSLLLDACLVSGLVGHHAKQLAADIVGSLAT